MHSKRQKNRMLMKMAMTRPGDPILQLHHSTEQHSQSSVSPYGSDSGRGLLSFHSKFVLCVLNNGCLSLISKHSLSLMNGCCLFSSEEKDITSMNSAFLVRFFYMCDEAIKLGAPSVAKHGIIEQ